MKRKNIKDIDMNNAYFHFTEKGNLKSIAQNGLKAQIEGRKQTLDEKKFIHQKEVDKQKLEIEREKAKKTSTSK